MENIKDKVKAIFKARGKTAKKKINKVDKAELPELSAEKVVKIGLLTIPIIWEPIATIPKLDFEVVNFLKELIFATWRTGKPISGFNIGVKSINLFA